MVETNTSSFDSSTSSPSMAHLPPIRVRGDEINDTTNRLNEEMKGGGAALLEQQFTSQLRVVPPPPPSTTTMAQPNHGGAKIMHRNDSNMSSGGATMSDDDGLSDHGGVPGQSQSRKPPLPLTLQQIRTTGGFNLPSSNDSKTAATAGISLSSPDSVKRYIPISIMCCIRIQILSD